jgi:cytochrome P450
VNIFNDEYRRDPYPLYTDLRCRAPVYKVPPPFDAWMIFDYEGVNRALNDHEAFSSRVPAPPNWFIFQDPPAHTRLRALVSKAFTPRTIVRIEPFIRQLSHSLLTQVLDRGRMDVATDFAVPLAMRVIAHIIGIPDADWSKFRAWSDSILKISYSRGADDEARRVMKEFAEVGVAMNDYLTTTIAERRQSPRNDLLTHLMNAEIEGQRLTRAEILGFFQLLVVGGQETTANLINNAVLLLLEHPSQMELLRSNLRLLDSAIEETLRYRAPIQWVMRTPTRTIQMHGETLLPGQLILAVIGSANRDSKYFDRAEQFEITRNPNPHLSFGHGVHYCIGSALARLEARIGLHDLLSNLAEIERDGDGPWEPRKALHVHGPTNLSIRFRRSQSDNAYGATVALPRSGE